MPRSKAENSLASSDKLPTEAPDSGTADGTQAIRRAVAILRLVATHRSPGASLSSICQAMQLPRSTTHRILKCLVSEGLLQMTEQDGRYVIGTLASELSLSGLRDDHSTAQWSALLPLLARKTGHTSYIIARSGREAVCIQRAEGHAVMRVAPIDVGQRRPLGVGAGATALLSQFDAVEIEEFAQSLGSALRPFDGITQESVAADALAAKELGYALSKERVLNGVAGIGIALPGHSPARLAISITGPTAYFDAQATEEIVQAIREEIEKVQL